MLLTLPEHNCRNHHVPKRDVAVFLLAEERELVDSSGEHVGNVGHPGVLVMPGGVCVLAGLADEQKGGLESPLSGLGQTTHRTKAPSSHRGSSSPADYCASAQMAVTSKSQSPVVPAPISNA